ncbi:MAG: energy transducer TonB [Polyangiales bacterium]
MTMRSYDAALRFGARGEGLGAFGAGLLAGALHLGLGLLSLAIPETPPAQAQPRAALDVELMRVRPTRPPAPVPTPALPEPPPEAESQPPPPAVRAPARARTAPPSTAPQAEAPPAARAGSLLTAAPDAPTQAAPVRFVTDASGASYGHGVVARGGTADHGAQGARAGGTDAAAAPAASPASGGDGITPASQLSRAPRLDEPDACRGHFPASSTSDQGVVVVLVVVRPDGGVGRVRVLRETPEGEGFGAGARRCLAGRRFTPGLDAAGTPTTAAARVTLRFSR